MKLLRVTLQGLLLAAPASAAGHHKRQQDPTDPGIAPDCTFWDETYTRDNDCKYFEDLYNLSHETFVSWNPSVKDDCSGIKIGHSYCVETNNGKPRTITTTQKPTSVPTTTKSTSTPVTTTSSLPSPTQDGLTKDCTQFYKAVSGDDCSKLVDRFGTFTFDDFLKWNPAVKQDCSGLWANEYYCVGVPGTPTSKPTSTKPTTTAHNNGVTTPTPTQPGMVDNCNKFYYVQKDDGCDRVAAANGISSEDFRKWNTGVGDDCSGLQANVYACIGVIGGSGGTTTQPSNGIQTPQPTQPDMVPVCNSFYYVNPGDNCGTIANNQGITVADIAAWNPRAGSDCTGLQGKANACVGTVGLYDFESGNLAGWQVIDGKYDASSKAMVASNSAGGKALIQADYNDFIFETDIKIGSSSGNAGVIFRVSGAGEGADNYSGYYAGIGDGNVVLSRANHDYNQLRNAQMGINAGQNYHLRVRASGDELSVFVDDMINPKIILNDGTFRSGRVGARVYSTDATFDNVRISPLVVDQFERNLVNWKIADGSFDGSSQFMYTDNVQSGKITLQDQFSNFILEADVMVLDDGGNAGLLFRTGSLGQGPDNYRGYYAGFGSDGSLVLAKADGSYHELGNARMDVQKGKYYHVKVQAQGSSLQVFVDDMGNPKINLQDGSYGGGMVGARVYSTGARFDNFRIQKV